jgi:hypothetical protein
MRVVVVKDERDAGELRRRLLKPGVTAARGRLIEDSIRTANPHVDLDDLRPGTVLVVPDHPDLADEPDETGRRAPAGGAVIGGVRLSAVQLASALPRVADAARRSAERSNDRAEELRRALDASEVRRAADGDDRLRTEVERLAGAVADEQRRTEAWAEAVRVQSEQWRAALDDLNRLG